MNGINLLPWREEKRQAQEKQMMVSGISLWVLCGLAVLGSVVYLNALQDNQKERNNYLKVEIRKLESKIKEINSLRARKDNLIARMGVIQDLQRERTQVVHLFDDIVRKLPDGVYYSTMNKKGKKFSFTGTAQSNARVSNLMDRLDSSDWFANPDLNVINVTPSAGVRLSNFNLKVSERKKPAQDESS